MATNYFQSQEFKKMSRDTADSAIKIIFRWGAWAFMAVINFIRDMFKMTVGK